MEFITLFMVIFTHLSDLFPFHRVFGLFLFYWVIIAPGDQQGDSSGDGSGQHWAGEHSDEADERWSDGDLHGARLIKHLTTERIPRRFRAAPAGFKEIVLIAIVGFSIKTEKRLSYPVR